MPYAGAPYAYGASYQYGVPYAAPYGAAPTRQQQVDALKGQAEYLEDALEGINKQIADLEAEGAEG